MQKTYNPKEFEKRIYDTWNKKNYFVAKVNASKKPFTMVMPPPNITGQLHMGHALNNTIQDVLARYKRAKGFEVLWLPGTDHASIATEVKIIEKLKSEGIDKNELGREGFLKAAFEWNDKFGGRIVEQLKQLGSSCDWSRQAFTMDEKCSKAVLEAFTRLYGKGLIYRGDRMINFCPECVTALSDAEVEHKESNSKLWYINYPIENEKNKFITVATTRPETMLGDTAVAVNPNDKRYKNLVGKFISLPLTNRKIPIIADSYVEASFGTGAVKITPAHDPNDFEVGKRHNLPIICVMDEKGKMAGSEAGEYKTLDRFVARKRIVADLEKLGLLTKTESRQNNVGVCYRCDTVIEPRISKQWFVKMDGLAKPAMASVKQNSIKFKPKRFDKIYMHWLKNIKDWCISRQLWWGHRIPAYYCKKCDNMQVEKQMPTKCTKCGSDKFKQDEDVLDTWFSSALWPFSTLGWPNKIKELDYFYPTDVLVTGYDIIFFWVARMVMSGHEFLDKKPFSTVLINGLVRDADGKKMSKSAGNGVDPLEIIDKYGADALRFSLLLGIATGADQRFSTDKIDSSRNFMNKIFNASKFVLGSCEGVKLEKDITKVKNLSLADKWVLSKLSLTIKAVSRALDKFETGQAASLLYDFIWTTFCDWFIECAKVGTNSTCGKTKNTTQNVLLFVLIQILKMLHPFVPFISEEIYQHMPNKCYDSIMLAPFSSYRKNYKKDCLEFENMTEIVKAIRNIRAENKLPPSKKIVIYIQAKAGNEALLVKSASYIAKLTSSSNYIFAKPTEPAVEIITNDATIYILNNDLIENQSKDIERLKKELDAAKFELGLANKKLSNDGFVAKAPKALLDAENAKIEKYTALIAKLEQAIG